MTSVEGSTDTQPSGTTNDEPVSDGRRLRRSRNRSAVITALLDMIREGDLRPGASDIADRAGVSHRSIFRYFDDLDDLVRTAIAQAFIDAAQLSGVPEIGEGDVSDRVDRFVDARVALFEFVDRPMQLARTRAYSIPSIDEEIATFAELFQEQVREHFAKELDGLPDAVSSAVVDAILVITSYDSFYIHTRLLHHDDDTIRSTWKTSLPALLRN